MDDPDEQALILGWLIGTTLTTLGLAGLAWRWFR